LKKYDAEVVRFFILRAHYRSPLNYSDAHLDDAKGALTRLYNAFKDVTPDQATLDWTEEHAVKFAEAMNDDFNTPIAVSVLFELVNEINKTKSAALSRQLSHLAATLGLLQRTPQQFLQAGPVEIAAGNQASAEIEALISDRSIAKTDRNFAVADQIRADLLEKGIILEDKPGGLTEWRRV